MSADLFAAFEDLSQPPPQQTQSNPNPPPSIQPTSTPLSFGSSFKPLAANPSQQWSQSSPASNQFQHSWQTAQPSPAPNTRPAPAATSPFANIQPINNDTEEDDGWGDFEVAPNSAPSPKPPPVAPVTPSLVNIKQPTPTGEAGKQRTRIIRASTLELVSNSLVNYEEPSTQPSPPVKLSPKLPEPKVPKKAVNTDPNVLFDADDFEGGQDVEGSDDDDDFGEFETVPPPAQHPSDPVSGVLPIPSSNASTVKKASELLLDLDLNKPTPNSTQIAQTKFGQVQAKNQKQGLDKPRSFLDTAKSQTTQTHTKLQTWGDDWNSFSDLPRELVGPPAKTTESTWDWDSVDPPKTTKLGKSKSKPPTPPSNDAAAAAKNDDASWDWDPIDVKAETVVEIEDGALPPINIPPPSILLSAFTQLFDQANEYLYKPISGQPQSIKDRVLSDPKVYDFLRGYLNLVVVAARIIAGRRVRWHRDKFLSQSMSISAAGSKGMKLAGIDKAQTTREDREAVDLVSHWKSQVGRLRSAVASANSTRKSSGEQLKIPELTDTVQLQTARDVPTAPKACVICGLKRNERLPKVDYEVEDSFGEWWVEHWGHVSCKRFWLQHENTLRQR
ncbi:hypothetical protein GQX73_g1445 [Xylaria multiplex]|uniref:Serine/threonine-protein kinase ppk6 n=1 Tax=Xylaria multiplex TaxID=323545 RepID=A0A7C8IYB5_9PEZI|nr:hypothetical protein GQX73_g1445 [Xylaria multiplex]